MLLKCENCGKLFVPTHTKQAKQKNHFCSRKCFGNYRKRTYTVYDNRTDLPVIVGGTVEECAEVMGIMPNSFYCLITRQRKSDKPVRWLIVEDVNSEE